MGWRYFDQNNDVVQDNMNDEDMSYGSTEDDDDDDDDNSYYSQVLSSNNTSSPSSASPSYSTSTALVRPIPIRPSEYKNFVFGSVGGGDTTSSSGVLTVTLEEDEENESVDSSVADDTVPAPVVADSQPSISEETTTSNGGSGVVLQQQLQQYKSPLTTIDVVFDLDHREAMSAASDVVVLDRSRNPSPPWFYTSSAFWDVERKLSNISSSRQGPSFDNDMMSANANSNSSTSKSNSERSSHVPTSSYSSTSSRNQGTMASTTPPMFLNGISPAQQQQQQQPTLYATAAFLAVQVIPLIRWDCCPMYGQQQQQQQPVYDNTMNNNNRIGSTGTCSNDSNYCHYDSHRTSKQLSSFARPVPLRVVDIASDTISSPYRFEGYGKISPLELPPTTPYMAIG